MMDHYLNIPVVVLFTPCADQFLIIVELNYNGPLKPNLVSSMTLTQSPVLTI